MKNGKIYCRDTKESVFSYQKYLETKHWKVLRARFVSEKTFFQCYCCQQPTSEFHVHHKTYKRIGREQLTDLAIMCPSCHLTIHDAYKNRVKKTHHLWVVGQMLRKKFIRERKSQKL